MHNDQLYPIKSIKLTYKMVEDAKKDMLLSSLLNDDTLVLEKKIHNNGENIQLALDAKNTTLAMQVKKRLF